MTVKCVVIFGVLFLNLWALLHLHHVSEVQRIQTELTTYCDSITRAKDLEIETMQDLVFKLQVENTVPK